MRVVTIDFLCLHAAEHSKDAQQAVRFNTVLFASEPLPTKIISSCSAFINPAMEALAFSIIARASRPNSCMLEGLPNTSIASCMAFFTSGCSGVVALWSKYTRLFAIGGASLSATFILILYFPGTLLYTQKNIM